MPTSPTEPGPILVFGAHPDDAEFGCGAILVQEARRGRAVHLVICSKGEAGTHGTPDQREQEARAAAAIMGVAVEFVQLDGDAHLEIKAAHALAIAAIIRRIRPTVVLAPTLVENQHPDHWRLGKLVRDACRLARYGGLKELAAVPPHKIGQLFFYAITDGAEPGTEKAIIVDVSDPEVVQAWQAAMAAHASQVGAIAFIELQLVRAKVHGLGAGRSFGQALYPNDPIVVDSLSQLACAARAF